MHELRWKWVSLLAALVLVISAGCGSDADSSDFESNQVADGDGGEVDGDGERQPEDGSGPDGCEEGEQFNPINGTCQPIEDEGDVDLDEDDDGEEEEEEEGPVLGCGAGALHGQACTTDGTRLPAATVTVSGQDCDGNSFELTTQTDRDGVFMLEDIPGGQHHMTVTSGSFSAQRPVDIFEGRTNTDLLDDDDKVCVDGDVSIMVVQGSYDNVPQLLSGMQLEYDTIGIGDSTNLTYFLSDPEEMAEYDIIFFACGSSFSNVSNGSGDFDQMMHNIRRFVENGNSIYASDWSSDFIHNTFPEAVDFYTDSPRVGDGQQTINADVTSSEMQTLLGRNTAELYFNAGGWVVATNASPPSVVHFRGDAEKSNGEVVHGAALLTTFTEPIGGGTVVYTSFHNNNQVDAGTDMHDILNFLIFQL